jgi:hypothetical protein
MSWRYLGEFGLKENHLYYINQNGKSQEESIMGSQDIGRYKVQGAKNLEGRAVRVLADLERGASLIREGGRCRLGGRDLEPEVAGYLEDQDLVVFSPDGEGVINDQGRALLRRTRAARRRKAALRAGEAGALAIHDPYRAQHQDVSLQRALPSETIGNLPKAGALEKRTYWVNDAESPLGWLRRRRDRTGRPLISAEQAQAGDRVRVDFELAGLAPRVTASWDGQSAGDRSSGYRELDPTEVQVMARRRFSRAMDYLGSGLSDVVMYSCCLLEGLEDVERRMGWPVRSGKVVLGLALDRLAEHYGLKKYQNGKNSS